MSDIETTTVCEEGFASTSQVGDFDLSIDATRETGPGPNEVLVADYASCYIPAFRVAGQKNGHDELGKVQIDASADVDDDDDLEAIRFDLYVEADVGDDADTLVSVGEDICHVHSALREGLHADITVHDDAF